MLCLRVVEKNVLDMTYSANFSHVSVRYHQFACTCADHLQVLNDQAVSTVLTNLSLTVLGGDLILCYQIMSPLIKADILVFTFPSVPPSHFGFKPFILPLELINQFGSLITKKCTLGLFYGQSAPICF